MVISPCTPHAALPDFRRLCHPRIEVVYWAALIYANHDLLITQWQSDECCPQRDFVIVVAVVVVIAGDAVVGAGPVIMAVI